MSNYDKGGKYIRLIRTVLVTGAAFLINLFIQLVLAPYVIEHVGTEAYGFVTLAKNFAQYAAIITMALNSFAARYITLAYHKEKNEEAGQYFSSVFYGDAFLAGAILLVACLVVWRLEDLVNISPELVGDVKILFLLVFLNFGVITLFTVFEAAAYIKNRLDIAGAFKGLSYMVEALVLILTFALFKARVFYVGLGLLAAAVTVSLGNIFICRSFTPDLKIRRKDFRLSAVKNLVVDGIWTSVNALGEVLNTGLDLLVCNLMLSPLCMGQIAVAKTVHTMFQGLFVIINPAFQPMFLKSYANKDMKGLLKELKLAMKVSGMMANLAFAGFAALGLAFYRLWIPGEDTRLIYELTVINMLTVIPAGPMQPLYYIYTLTLKKKVPCLITIAGGLCNVAGMYLLIRYTSLGVYAVVWTTAVDVMIVNFITNPLYMAHVLKLPYTVFYPEILRNVACCFALTLLLQGMAALYMPGSWLGLICWGIVCAGLGLVFQFFILFAAEDRRAIMAMVKSRAS